MSDFISPEPNEPNDPNAGKGMSIAAMVLGICSLVVPYGGTVTAIVGLVLGVVSRKKLQENGQPYGMASAGIVLSVIALAWSVLFIIICTSCMAAGGLTGIY